MERKCESAEHLIRRLIKEQVDAYNRGDAAGFLKHIAEDRIAMNPEQPLSVGKGDAEELQVFFDSIEQKAELVVDELVISGEWAFERGRGVGTLSPKHEALDPAASYSYKYLRIWQLRNGRWLVVRSIWNSSQKGLSGPSPQPVEKK